MVILMFIHVVITLAMIGAILLQRSEGGGLGMGASPTNSMFSARGTANLLTRVTAVLFCLFVGNALLMGILSKRHVNASILKIDTPVQTPASPTVQPEGPQHESAQPETSQPEALQSDKAQPQEKGISTDKTS